MSHHTGTRLLPNTCTLIGSSSLTIKQVQAVKISESRPVAALLLLRQQLALCWCLWGNGRGGRELSIINWTIEEVLLLWFQLTFELASDRTRWLPVTVTSNASNWTFLKLHNPEQTLEGDRVTGHQDFREKCGFSSVQKSSCTCRLVQLQPFQSLSLSLSLHHKLGGPCDTVKAMS